MFTALARHLRFLRHRQPVDLSEMLICDLAGNLFSGRVAPDELGVGERLRLAVVQVGFETVQLAEDPRGALHRFRLARRGSGPDAGCERHQQNQSCSPHHGPSPATRDGWAAQRSAATPAARRRVGKSSNQTSTPRFQVCGTALRMALPPLITTLNSMFFALCFCISSGTCERMREASESKESPSVDSPQRWRATR